MKLASKERVVDDNNNKKKRESVQDRNTNNNPSGVVITVYEESVTPRSRKLSHDPTKKTKAHPHDFTRPRAAPTTPHGYDRRAQLLALTRQLRNNHAPSQKVPFSMPPTIQTQPKNKKGFWLTKPVRICSCSPSRYMPLRFSSGGCRQERVESEENKERNCSKNRKSIEKACPQLLSKMKKMLKELSCKEI